MQYSDICARAAFLSMQAGWDTAMPAPDWKALVNRAYVDFSWDTELNEEQVDLTTVANQADYTIDTATPPRYFQTIKDVAYNSSGSSGKGLEKTNEDTERSLDALWFTRAAGTPSKYIHVAANTIRLIDKPNTSSVTFTVRGTRNPTALSSDSDLPIFPDTWHEALALRAAVLFCEPWYQASQANDKLELYRTQYAGMVRECRAFLGRERYGTIVRQVRRPNRRRTLLRLSSGRY